MSKKKLDGVGHENWSYHGVVWNGFTSDEARREHEQVFRTLAPRLPALAGFQDAESLVGFLWNDESEEYDHKDAIYLSLIGEQQVSPSGALLSLLVRGMLRALVKVFFRRAKKLSDAVEQDDLCSRVLAAFAETVARYPIENWPRGVAENLRLNTITRLRASETSDTRQYEALQKQEEAADALLAELDRTDESGPKGVWDEQMAAEEPAAPPDAEDLAELSARLEEYVENGFILSRDAPLLFEVCGLGRPIAEVAEELGISEKAAQKRKDRALEHIRDQKPRRGRKK